MSNKISFLLIFLIVSLLHFWLFYRPIFNLKIIKKSKPDIKLASKSIHLVKLQNLPIKKFIKNQQKINKKSVKNHKKIIKKSKIKQKTIKKPLKTSKISQKSSTTDSTLIKAKYLSEIHQIIQQNLQYPTTAKRLKISGIVTVLFTVFSDGKIKNIRLKTKERRFLSKFAIQAVVKSKLPKFPKNLPKTPLEINIPVVFRLE